MSRANGNDYSQIVSASQPNIEPPRSYSPYGVSFGDEAMYRKRQQQKYKEDLDYLCSLRRKDKMLREREIQDENRRIRDMNDVSFNYNNLYKIEI